jgi:hypothetical protein
MQGARAAGEHASALAIGGIGPQHARELGLRVGPRERERLAPGWIVVDRRPMGGFQQGDRAVERLAGLGGAPEREQAAALTEQSSRAPAPSSIAAARRS